MNTDQPVAPDSTLEKSPDNHNTGETSVMESTPVAVDTSVSNGALPYLTLSVGSLILVLVVAVIIVRKMNGKK